jgi:MGS-like domain
LAAAGVETTLLHFPSTGESPSVLDALRTRSVDLVVNLPTSESVMLADNYTIRRTAVDLNIPLLTNLNLVRLFADAMGQFKANALLGLLPESLFDYYERCVLLQCILCSSSDCCDPLLSAHCQRWCCVYESTQCVKASALVLQCALVLVSSAQIALVLMMFPQPELDLTCCCCTLLIIHKRCVHLYREKPEEAWTNPKEFH